MYQHVVLNTCCYEVKIMLTPSCSHNNIQSYLSLVLFACIFPFSYIMTYLLFSLHPHIFVVSFWRSHALPLFSVLVYHGTTSTVW